MSTTILDGDPCYVTQKWVGELVLQVGDDVDVGPHAAIKLASVLFAWASEQIGGPEAIEAFREDADFPHTQAEHLRRLQIDHAERGNRITDLELQLAKLRTDNLQLSEQQRMWSETIGPVADEIDKIVREFSDVTYSSMTTSMQIVPLLDRLHQQAKALRGDK